MNILITGIHGFVGSNLVEALKYKHTIYGLDIISPVLDGVVFTYSWAELDKIPSVDVVIHLAGIAHDTKNQTESKRYFEINTGLSKVIYDWFLLSSAKKYIHFSSVKAVADTIIGDVLTEEVVPAPKDPYGESKYAAECYIAQNPSVDKLIYVLRPCLIHGPGNKGNLNLLYRLVKSGVPYPLGSFNNKRSFTSIDNLSFIISQLVTENILGGIYNISDDECLSTNELIVLISSILQKPSRIWKCNIKLIIVSAKIGMFFHLPFNSDRLKKLTENYVVSNSKIKRALNIEKLPITAYKGFERTIKSFDGAK